MDLGSRAAIKPGRICIAGKWHRDTLDAWLNVIVAPVMPISLGWSLRVRQPVTDRL
jgi:hypothetical protein